MKLDTFFDNFELLSDAPNGVQMLREMILQLAVQGKLVPQDPKDEPASVLLEKIKAEKKRLIKEGKIRKQKSNSEIKEEEKPFVLPEGWQWCRLGDSGAIFNGNSLNSRQKTSYSNVTNGLPYIATKHVGYGALHIDYSGEIKIPTNEPKFKIAHRNAVLICSEGGSAGRKIGLIDRDICFGNKLLANETFSGMIPKFVFYMYQSPFFSSAFKAKMTGIIGGISITNFLGLVIPLPPSAEQKRIVTKVDELMALCDELEAHKQQISLNCIQLNNASIHKLLTARDSEKFSKHWQRICDNFDLLYSKPENVNKLRQTILQLAVQGKLVPQDPKDEPASVLLEKIKAEKERLVKENKIKKSKQFPPIDPSDVPYNLPNGWEWVKLEQIRKTIEYGTSSKASPNDIGIPILRMNNIQNGKLFYDNLKYVKKDIKDLPRLLLKKNDILFNRTNSYELVGKTALYTYDDDLFTFASYLIRVSIFTDWIDPEYTANAINSYYFRHTQIEPEVTQQCGQANFNGTKLANTLLPLPSSKEQKRIVAKVDELMALCDELETSLSQSQTGCDMLMEAAVAEILAA